MSSSRIVEVHAWEALDSRGRPTVACAIRPRDGSQGRVIPEHPLRERTWLRTCRRAVELLHGAHPDGPRSPAGNRTWSRPSPARSAGTGPRASAARSDALGRHGRGVPAGRRRLDYRDTVTDFQMPADDDLSGCIAYASWLSRDMGLRLQVGYLRWLDIHAASRAGQRQGHLALGELDVVSPGRIAGSHRDGSADWFGISFGRHLVHPDL